MCRETMESPNPGHLLVSLQWNKAHMTCKTNKTCKIDNRTCKTRILINVVDPQTLASELMEPAQQQLMELDLNLPFPPARKPIMERSSSPTLPTPMDVANSFEKAAAIERNHQQRIIKKRVSAARSRERKKAFDVLFPGNSTQEPKDQLWHTHSAPF